MSMTECIARILISAMSRISLDNLLIYYYYFFFLYQYFILSYMGTTDSKLAFRKGVFRLFEERVNKEINKIILSYIKS